MTGSCPLCGRTVGRLGDNHGEGVAPYCQVCLGDRIHRAQAGERLEPLSVLRGDGGRDRDEEIDNEAAVAAHLRAQATFGESDAVLAARAREKVKRMLEEVTPGRPICSYTRKEKGKRSQWVEAGEEEPSRIFVCDKPGYRMVAITGTWVCREHDPLRFPRPHLRLVPDLADPSAAEA